jgi:hypothetical protein
MKKLIKISILFALPTALTTMIYLAIAMDQFIGNGDVLNSYLSGQNALIGWLSGFAFFCIMSMMITLIITLPLANKMVNYEDEVTKLHEEQKAYAEAKKKLISAALKLEKISQ